jgi:hypothetical protein
MNRWRVDAQEAVAALLAWIGSFVLMPAPAPASQSAATDEAALAAELEAKRDDADPEVLAKLALKRSKGAAEALVGFYGRVASTWMKREVLRALAGFDGAGEAAPIALDHVATVAANAPEIELQEAAFAALESCVKLAPAYLKRIVELPVQDQARERALRLHGRLSDPAVHGDWYQKLFLDEKLPPKLREVAFEARVPGLKDGELIKAFKDVHSGALRRIALEELARRDAVGVPELALDTLKQVNALPTDRAVAARILAEKKGPKSAEALLEIGTNQATTGEHLRAAVGALVGAMDDDGLRKRLAGMVGKGKPHERLFALHATKGLLVADDKLRKKVRGEADEKDDEVRRLAIRILGEVGDVEAIELLEKQLSRSKVGADAPVLVAALSRLHGATNESWRKRLLAYAVGADRDLRNAALQALSDPPIAVDLALHRQALAHEDWSTRLIALSALERLRDVDGVGAIVEQMQREEGRTLSEFGAALFRLTGELHDTDAATWKKWWEAIGRSLPLITAAELEKKVADRERKRLRQTTVARFFGVRIESRHVMFVIDVSGSMAEQLHSVKVGDRAATRMEVLKQELVKALQALEPGASFNLCTFNAAVQKWKDTAVAMTDKTRAEAVDWVEHLGSRGGTNIYDAIVFAFADPTIDTIFLLTDGEPSAGTVTDLGLIRQHIAGWNATRHVKIHCIAVGSDFPLLEWIAQDAGGTYTKFN